MHINYFYRHFAAIKQHHFKDVSFLFFHLLSLSFTFKTTFFYPLFRFKRERRLIIDKRCPGAGQAGEG